MMTEEIECLTCEMCGRETPLEDAWTSLQHTCGRLSCLGPRWIAVLIGNLATVGALATAYSRGWWAGTMHR